MSQLLGGAYPNSFHDGWIADCVRDGLWIMRELDYALYGGRIALY